MIHPNPRHLRAFVALVDTGSFGAAAQAVHVGQPALSHAIAKLEGLVGVRLVERSSRSVRLTPAGQEFLVGARRVLQANDELMARGSEWGQARRGRIELLSLPSMAHRLLPALVREFAKRHPNVRVDVHDHADPVLKQRLERGEGDLAIVTQLDHAASETYLPFLRDRFRVVVPADHRLALQESVNAAQLADEQMILLRRGALFRSFADAALRGLTLASPPIEVDQALTLTGMVEAGLGITLLPALSCPPQALRSVTTRPLARPEIARSIAFARPPRREAMPAVQEFVRTCLVYLAATVTKLPEGCELMSVAAPKLKKFFSTSRATLAA